MMMKRGLSTLNPNATSEQVFLDRQEKVRRSLRDREVDAALIYCDVSTGADIAYLTHATLYWSNGILLIAANGATVLFPALSPRTENWFTSTAVFDEIISGTDLVSAISDYCRVKGYGSVGVVDEDRFPSALLSAFAETGLIEVTDLGPLIRELRSVPDPAAHTDLAEAARIGAEGAETATRVLMAGAPREQARAEAEFAIRMAGAWDATVFVHPARGAGAIIDVRCQLRDAWYASERLAGGTQEVSSWTDALLALLVERLGSGAAGAELRVVAESFARDNPLDGVSFVDVELQGAPDVETRISQGRSTSALASDRVVHLVLAVWASDGVQITAAGDTYLLTEESTPLPIRNWLPEAS